MEDGYQNDDLYEINLRACDELKCNSVRVFRLFSGLRLSTAAHFHDHLGQFCLEVIQELILIEI